MSSLFSLRRVFWACGLLLLLLAWLRPLALPDEGRYGDIGRYMMVSGDWLAPRLDGVPFFHKPPLLHWLQAAVLTLTGAHPWASRLVIIGHALLMLWVTAWVARRWFDEQVAQRAVLMLGTSLAFLIGGQYINHDMLVATWIAVAIACFGLSLLRDGPPDAGLARWGFVACGVGVLAKGLIGLVLPGLVMVVWVTLTRRWRQALRLPWFSGLALFALVALPWFVWVERVHPGVFDYLIIGQHFGRYTGSTFNNPWPWWFYPLVLVGLLFPWALFAYGAALRAWFQSPLGWWRPLSHERALLWVWLLAITVFFSLPRSKLVGYILPVLPPLAVLAALVWQNIWGARPWANQLLAMVCLSNLSLAIGLNQLAGTYTLGKSSADVAAELACRIQPGDPVWVAGSYPYDLPYLAQLSQPVVVLSDWEQARQSAGDNWQREIFEGERFDPAMAARVMQPLTRLYQPPETGAWLVTPNSGFAPSDLPQWQIVVQGRAWTLWGATVSTRKGPPAPEQKGLGCGNHHRPPQ
jgi:4-amino-4-deoxy-L-arabinose transferase-like glycosyltransferase